MSSAVNRARALAAVLAASVEELSMSFGVVHRVFLTPELASDLLAANHRHNRRQSKSRISNIARAALDGLPFLNPIVLSASGQMIDGQHRTSAVSSLDSGGVDVMIVVLADGIDSHSVMLSLDIGQGRRVNELASMTLGMGVSPSTAAGVEIARTNGHLGGGVSKELRAQHVIETGLLRELESLGGRSGHRSSGPVVGACLRCMEENDVRNAMAFFTSVSGGSPLVHGAYASQANLLIRWLDDTKGRVSTRGASRREMYAKCISAFNAWTERREIKHLRWDGKTVPSVSRVVRVRLADAAE